MRVLNLQLNSDYIALFYYALIGIVNKIKELIISDLEVFCIVFDYKKNGGNVNRKIAIFYRCK